MQIVTSSSVNLGVGVWLILAPFVLGHVNAATGWNDIIVGVGIVAFAGIRVSGAFKAAWLSWANFLLGAWLIVAPFVLGYGTTRVLWNDVIAGVVILIFATWSAMTARRNV
jgi:hypothetical protein